MKNLNVYVGKLVKIKDWVLDEDNGQRLAGKDFLVEGYWKDLNNGISWQDTSLSNFAIKLYALRLLKYKGKIPSDDNVIYGKVGMFGHLLHESEIELNGIF